MNKKVAHLEFIHNTINRMSASSFSIKGWTMTLVVALLAYLGTQKEVNLWYGLIVVLPIISFWILNGFFLQQERLYRALYDKVRIMEEENVDFSMNTYEFKSTSTWFKACMAKTILVFYVPIFIISILGIVILA